MEILNGDPPCTVYVWSRHPLALHVIRNALASDQISCASFELTQMARIAEQRTLQILMVDICSVEEWSDIRTRWHARHGRVILLASEEWGGHQAAVCAMRLGVSGVVPFSRHFDREIADALRSVVNGRIWLRRDAFEEHAKRSPDLHRPFSLDDDRFTPRQEEILGLLIGGVPNKSIAEKLRLSERTVKYHISHIFKKLRVLNRRELFLNLNRYCLKPFPASRIWQIMRTATTAPIAGKRYEKLG